MKEIINWLLKMEHLAGNVYREAAKIFSGDKLFSEFLSGMAGDEDEHYRLLKEAEQKLSEIKDHPPSEITVDKKTRDRVEFPLQELYKQITAAVKISKQAAMKIIVSVEFAELNPVFLYVLSTFKKKDKELKDIELNIQSHVDRIKRFLKEHSDELDLSDLIEKLPPVGKDRLLVVADKKPIKLFLAQALDKYGAVETAENGQEALEKVRKGPFILVISDIDMPVMNGVEFFQKAMEINPGLHKQFLFCARSLTEEAKILCNIYEMKFLKIPFGINQLHNAVQSLIGASG